MIPSADEDADFIFSQDLAPTHSTEVFKIYILF